MTPKNKQQKAPESFVVMSSWSEVLDENLMQSGHIHGCMIVGHDGHCWAKTEYFAPVILTENEDEVLHSDLLSQVLNAFVDPNHFLEHGFIMLENHYTILQQTEQLIVGKKGFNGIFLLKTNQTIVFAVYNMDNQPSESALLVEKFAHYLHSQSL